MLSVVFFICYAECHYSECRYAECHGAITKYVEKPKKQNITKAKNGVTETFIKTKNIELKRNTSSRKTGLLQDRKHRYRKSPK